MERRGKRGVEREGGDREGERERGRRWRGGRGDGEGVEERRKLEWEGGDEEHITFRSEEVNHQPLT